MQFTRFTIFHVMWLAGVPLATLSGASHGYERFGWFGAVGLGVLGFILSHIAWCLLMVTLRWLNMMQIASMSTENLWKSVRGRGWNMNQTLALLQLSARNENVETELPRILAMLSSESMLERVYGWDALRLVFTSKVASADGYDPCESAETCRRKIEPLLHAPDSSN